MSESLRGRLAVAAADTLARIALRSSVLERALVMGCRQRLLRRALRLDAVAIGYSRVLRRRELRVARLGRYRLHVNVAEPLGIHPYFFGESGALWLTEHLVRPGDTCVDAGANVGHYTFSMASLAGRRGRVIAFEPNTEFAELIRRSVTLNGYDGVVRVDPRALFDVSGEERDFFISVNAANSGTSSLVNHGWYLSAEAVTRVRTVTLADALHEHGVEHVRLLKIDVERAEDSVIAGARPLLAAHRIDYVILEQHAGSEAQRILRACNYDGYYLDAARQQGIPLDAVPEGTFGDFLFVAPQERRRAIDLLGSAPSRGS